MPATPIQATSNNNGTNVAPANANTNIFERRRNNYLNVVELLSSHLQEDLNAFDQSTNRIAELEKSLQTMTERAEGAEKREMELKSKVKELQKKLSSKNSKCKCKEMNEKYSAPANLTPLQFAATDFISEDTNSSGVYFEEVDSHTFEEDFVFNCVIELGDTKFVPSQPQPQPSTSTSSRNLVNRPPNTARKSTGMPQINRRPNFWQQNDRGRDHGQASMEQGVDGTLVYVCKCDKRFKSRDALYQHTRAIWKAWNCCECRKEFVYFRQLAKHLRSIHGKDIKDDFGCHSCGQTFEDRSQISKHLGHCMKRHRVGI